MPPDYDLVAIGNAIVDIMRRCDEGFISLAGSQMGQMHLVNSSASIANLCSRLPPGIEVAGGSAANTAVGVASFGGRAAFIGKVAEDQYGRIFRHDIRGTGVTFDLPATSVTGKETSHSLILVSPDGRRTMNSFLGCSTELNDATLDCNLIRSSKYLYIEGYLLDSAATGATVRKAVDISVSARRSVALSLSDASCVSRSRPEFHNLIKSGVSMVFANENELLSLYETGDFEEAVSMIGKDVALAVVTRSENGSIIISDGKRIELPVERVRKVVDATGAGDLYASGFIYGLTRNLDLQSAGRLGSFAASEIISQFGARPEGRLGQIARMRGFLQ